MHCTYCGKEIPDGEESCPSCRDSKLSQPPVRSTQTGKKPKDRGCQILLLAGVVFLLFSLHIATIGYMPPRGKSLYTTCFEQLSHVKIGMESYLTENKDLYGMDPYGEGVCNHILAGFQKAADCRGEVAARVATVCDNFKITYVKDSSGVLRNYEITGNAKDKKKCGIVVTEVEGMPEKYDDCKEEIPRPVH